MISSLSNDIRHFIKVAYLVFQVHEDLNTASKRNKSNKRYKFQVKSGNTNTNESKSGTSSETANQVDEAQQAADALDSYMRSNNSFVMDIFQVTIKI